MSEMQGPVSGMTQAVMRSSNLALVMRKVADHSGRISRADIAHQLGMTRSTVSRLVDDLIDGGLVAEGAASGTGRGRPAVPLSLRRGTALGLGLQVGVGRLAAVLVDLDGTVEATAETMTDVPKLGLAASVEELQRLSGQVLGSLPEGGHLIGAFAAIPGLLDLRSGRVVRAPNLGWDGESLGAHWALTHEGGRVPLAAANDATCAAVTVMRSDPDSSFLLLCGDVGIGGALCRDGTLVLGEHGWSGELGHICVDPRGVPCRCGSIGCMETIVSLPALLSASRQPSLEAYRRALTNGDERAESVLRRTVGALGIGLGAAMNVWDVSTIRLCCYFAELEPWLREPLTRQLMGRVVWGRKAHIDVGALPALPLRPAIGAGLIALGPVVKDPDSFLTRGAA